jgi:hypothetical protein
MQSTASAVGRCLRINFGVSAHVTIIDQVAEFRLTDVAATP